MKQKGILVGYGYWGQKIEKYALDAGFDQIVIFQDKDLKKFEKNITDQDIDTVFICSPLSTHSDYLRISLENKKNIFCEKMLVSDYKLATTYYKRSETNGTVLFTDYTYLYSKAISEMVDLIKKLGGARYIYADISQYGKFYDDADAFQTIGVHMASVIGLICEFDMNINIHHKARIKVNRNFPDIDIIEGKIGNVLFLLKDSLASSKKRTVEVICERGIVVFDALKEKTIQYWNFENPEGVKYKCFDEGNNLSYCMKEFKKNTESEYNDMNLRCSLFAEKVYEILNKNEDD